MSERLTHVCVSERDKERVEREMREWERDREKSDSKDIFVLKRETDSERRERKGERKRVSEDRDGENGERKRKKENVGDRESVERERGWLDRLEREGSSDERDVMERDREIVGYLGRERDRETTEELCSEKDRERKRLENERERIKVCFVNEDWIAACVRERKRLPSPYN